MTALAFVMASMGLQPAGAAEYPVKPIRIVVPWQAGTGTDQNARVIGQQITAISSQPVVVENKPGAGGSLGTADVARAPADGYTILATSNAHVANPFLMKKLSYDPIADFIPVGSTRRLPSLIVARPGLHVSNVAQLVELAKRKPGTLTFGAGTSAGRLGMELFQQRAGIEMIAVPYKSATAALSDLLGEHCDVMLIDIYNVYPQIKAGKVTALAATGSSRLKVLPDLRTVAESGFPGFDVSSWSGIWVKKGTPPNVVRYLSGIITKAGEAERKSVEELGGEVLLMTPEEFSAFITSESQLWKKTATAAKIEPE